MAKDCDKVGVEGRPFGSIDYVALADFYGDTRVLACLPYQSFGDMLDFGQPDREKSPVSIPKFLRRRSEIARDFAINVRPGSRFVTVVVGMYSNRSPYINDLVSQPHALRWAMSPQMDSRIFAAWALLCGYPSPGTAFGGEQVYLGVDPFASIDVTSSAAPGYKRCVFSMKARARRISRNRIGRIRRDTGTSPYGGYQSRSRLLNLL